MTALYVILAVLLVIAALMLCPLTLTATYDMEAGFKAKLRYLFLSYQLAPPKEKKEKKDKPKKKQESTPKEPQEENKKNRFQEIIEEKGLSGFLTLLKELAGIASDSTRRIVSHVVVRNLSAFVVIATDDAAVTAVAYGTAGSVIYSAISLLAGNTNCKKYEVSVAPDFESKESRIDFLLKVSIRPCFLLSAGFRALIQFLRLNKKVVQTK